MVLMPMIYWYVPLWLLTLGLGYIHTAVETTVQYPRWDTKCVGEAPGCIRAWCRGTVVVLQEYGGGMRNPFSIIFQFRISWGFPFLNEPHLSTYLTWCRCNSLFHAGFTEFYLVRCINILVRTLSIYIYIYQYTYIFLYVYIFRYMLNCW